MKPKANLVERQTTHSRGEREMKAQTRSTNIKETNIEEIGRRQTQSYQVYCESVQRVEGKGKGARQTKIVLVNLIILVGHS